MLSPRALSRERVVFLSVIVAVVVSAIVGVLVFSKTSAVKTERPEFETLRLLEARIPTPEEVQAIGQRLEALSPILLEHRASGERAVQNQARAYDPNAPILPRRVRFDDPGIGTVLVVRWEFDQPLSKEQEIGIWRTTTIGNIGERVATIGSDSRQWVDWRAEHEVPFYYTIQALPKGGTPRAGTLQYAGRSVDRLPPDPPRGVTVSTGENPRILRIAWQELSPDAAGVMIYRSERAGERGIKIADKATELFWEDRTVEAGKNYFYLVTAVDRAGNESASLLTPPPISRDDPFVAPTEELSSLTDR